MSQFQGFGGLIHPTRVICDVTLCLASFCTTVYIIYICSEFEERQIFISQTTKVWNLYGTYNACMELVGFITSKKVKNRCVSGINTHIHKYVYIL